jgi:hypothetical protein
MPQRQTTRRETSILEQELQKQLLEISNFDNASGASQIDLQYRVPTCIEFGWEHR